MHDAALQTDMLPNVLLMQGVDTARGMVDRTTTCLHVMHRGMIVQS